MNISDETTAKEAIAMWRSKAPKEQLRHIRQAIETLELNQMHYENRGNEKGIIRSEKAIDILIQRRTEIESGL
ncbi:MAG: hypothetical protein KKH84_06240 [Proteobacteria bacterium]|nr:hypothetical protein [Pseudomonadota bacterium]MCG2758567.1 hypothetical protein [Desulfobacteraceae bacterium]MBU4067121.1 hypothetical protein [Pseudomonadota bacterium]MBU4102133.1 hypothetical protein [Pseudomonadota bacterium]MBU4127074.1 hypothetical protein [Pseudomonadota bacterium]